MSDLIRYTHKWQIKGKASIIWTFLCTLVQILQILVSGAAFRDKNNFSESFNDDGSDSDGVSMILTLLRSGDCIRCMIYILFMPINLYPVNGDGVIPEATASII